MGFGFWQSVVAQDSSQPLRNIQPPKEIFSEPAKQEIPALKVRAYPLQAVTAMSGQQTIHIHVVDRTLVPVEGAQITLALRFPSGERRLYLVKDLTDSNGITKITFSYTTTAVGLVQISVEAVRNRLTGYSNTSFLIWW